MSNDEKPQGQSQQPNEPLTIDFTTFIFSLSTQALALMGEAKLPGQEQIIVDLAGANQTISIIEMLAEKTKGNLSEAEDKTVKNFLHDLKMAYVQCLNKSKEK